MSVFAKWLAVLAFAGAIAHAQPSTAWNSTTGDWTNASLWTAGLPTASTTSTFIDNGGTVQLGGSAAGQFVWLGSTSGKSGALEIGAGGSATFTTIVVGGTGGTGALRVQNGGVLSSYGGPIGSDLQGVGTALIDGAGSRWQLTGPELIVGGNGTGTLTLANGGVLTVGGGTGQVGLADNAVSQGTLLIGNGGAPGTLNAVDVHGHEGSAKVIFNHTASSYTFAPGLYDNLSVQHIGSGRTILAASTSNYFGSTTISAGELIVQGSLQGTNDFLVLEGGTLGGTGSIAGFTDVAGTLSPGLDGVGLLTFGGSLSLSSSATFVMELGGLIRGTQFDAVNLTGQLSYGGELSIRFVNGFEPQLGDSFKLFGGFTSRTGTFAELTFARAGFAGSFNPVSGTVTITAVPEPGAVGLLVAGLATLALRRRKPIVP